MLNMISFRTGLGFGAHPSKDILGLGIFLPLIGFISAIIGSAFIFKAIQNSVRLREIKNFLLCSLAVNDIVSVVLNTPLLLLVLLHPCWTPSPLMKHCLSAVPYYLHCSSTWHQTGLALQSYFSICRRSSTLQTRWGTWVVMVCCWVCPLVIIAPLWAGLYIHSAKGNTSSTVPVTSSVHSCSFLQIILMTPVAVVAPAAIQAFSFISINITKRKTFNTPVLKQQRHYWTSIKASDVKCSAVPRWKQCRDFALACSTAVACTITLVGVIPLITVITLDTWKQVPILAHVVTFGINSITSSSNGIIMSITHPEFR